GRALALEEELDLLDPTRRQILGARHLAARSVVAGASFVEVVRALVDDEGVALEAALRVAFRVQRGAFASGASVTGGLARELVYLPALLAVRKAVSDGRTTTAALGSARLSIDVRARSGLDTRR
ncbi:MAG: tyrosine/phenylalanine carboxypeptidase domain-containing protein, partial [Polyangiales bacterium]